MNVAANDETRTLCKHCIANGGAAEMSPTGVDVQDAIRRGMRDENCAFGEIAEVRLGFLLREVITPGAKWRDRHSAAKPEEGHAGNLDRLAMQDGRGGPDSCSRAQVIGPLGVARDEHRG